MRDIGKAPLVLTRTITSKVETRNILNEIHFLTQHYSEGGTQLSDLAFRAMDTRYTQEHQELGDINLKILHPTTTWV